MMRTVSGSRRSLARGGAPPIFALVGLLLLPLTAAADECPPGTYPISAAALRQCDADQTALPEVRLQLRVAEQRLTVATGDSLVLARALDAQSRLVVTLRRDLRAASAWGPRWAWLALGAVLGVAGSVVLALSL